MYYGVNMLLTTTWFGTFLIDLNTNKIKKKKLFPKDLSKLVEHMKALQNQEILKEEQALVKSVKEQINVSDERLTGLGDIVDGVLPVPDEISIAPEDFGFNIELYHEAMLELGKARMRVAVSAKDLYVVQAVKGLDDLTQIANLLSERLHEWYGLHWPELESIVKENEYVEQISMLGDRETIHDKSDNKKLQTADISDSVGSTFDPEDKDAVMGFASELKSVLASRTVLENYIKTRMDAVAPNISHLTGPIIGARLIALTGGLTRLSRVPSSTIQLLGAEKALFRHLRDGERPPKHGIIFQHPFIHNAPYWQRGKIARAFAGKIAIAAKIDQNSERFLGKELAVDLERRIEEIRKKYPAAPAKKQRAMGKGFKKRGGDGRGYGGNKTRRGKRGKGKGKRRNNYSGH
jgi:nucleolar protein 56